MKRYGKGILACVSVLCSLGVSTAAPAIDDEGATVPPVLIGATRTEQSVESATSSVTVVTAKELQERQIINVADALRLVVGVDVTHQGSLGGATSVFLRGANSQHTLVMIDGVQVNNPTTGGFDFADLTTDNVERIEIIRGAQSTLYGSDAIGGVIHIITKKGRGAPSVTLTGEGGRYDTGRGGLSVAGQSGPVDYSASLSHERSEGFSHAASGTEPDGYLNTTFSSNIGLAVAGDGRLEFIGRYTLAQSDLDNGFGPSDDLTATQRTERLVVLSRLQKPLTTWWNQRLALSANIEEFIHNQFGEFDVRSQRADWQHDLSMGEWGLFTFGSEYEGQVGENSGDLNDHTMNTYAFFGQSQLHWGSFSQVAGIRYDNNNRFGSTFTYKLEAAYLIEPTQTRLRAGYGTGFRGPTIQDLFYPGFSNSTLQPETSETAEVGVEQSFWDRRLAISVTHFQTNFDNLIALTFDPLDCPPGNPFGCPINVDTARSVGQEVVVTLTPVERVTVTSSYTHTTAKDETTDLLLLRRPRSKAHFGVTATPVTGWTVTSDVNFVGKRRDVGNSVAASYWLVRLASQYAVTRFLTVYGRIENLLDTDYEEAVGYQTAGLSIFGGLRATWP